MALLRVFAHHNATPAAFGAPSLVVSGAPGLIATYWAELSDQTIVTAQGFGPPVLNGAVTVPGGGTIPNISKPVDDGFTGGINFSLTSVWIVGINGTTEGFDYTLIAPTGQLIAIATPPGGALPAPGGSGNGYSAPIGIALAKGVWKIEVRLKPGSGAQTSEFEWNGAGLTVPYIGITGSPRETLLALVFVGNVTVQPPPVCHLITATNTAVPCSSGGTTPVSATFTASITPAVPPYPGVVDWDVTNAAGASVFSLPGGGPIATLQFPGAGTFTITATIVRPGCSPIAKVWSKQITVLSCGGGGGGGGGGISLGCLIPLVPAMMLTALAGVSLALWGCTGAFNPVFFVTAATSAASALVLFGLWMFFCRDCWSITFLRRYFRIMGLLMFGIASVLLLFGQVGCAKAASAIGILFLTDSGAFELGAKAIGCP